MENNREKNQINNEIESKSNLTTTDSFDQLAEENLHYIFRYLNIVEKIKIERVCKRWQRIILSQLNSIEAIYTTISTDPLWNCSQHHVGHGHSPVGGDIRGLLAQSRNSLYDLTKERSQQNIIKILEKCHSIKSIHLNYSIINVKTIEILTTHCKTLECLQLRSIVLTPDEGHDEAGEWLAIGDLLKDKLIHLAINSHYEFRINEDKLTQLLKNLINLKELRLGAYIEKFSGSKFMEQFQAKELTEFHAIDKDFDRSVIEKLTKYSKSLIKLSFHPAQGQTEAVLRQISLNFTNLIHLKLQFTFFSAMNNLVIKSPLGKLTQLKNLTLDLGQFFDEDVDDGLLFMIKDGIDSLESLELIRACLSPKSFGNIKYCLPQLKKLTLHTIDIQCICVVDDLLDKIEKNSCTLCRTKAWKSVAELRQLNQIQLIQMYHRQQPMKRLHDEFIQQIKQFTSLKRMRITCMDISNYDLIQTLIEYCNEMLTKLTCSSSKSSSSKENQFILILESVSIDFQRIKFRFPSNFKISLIHFMD